MIFKNGIKLSGSLIMAAIISIFLCFSINVICSALFTAEIGYNAYVYESETATEPLAQYEYFYSDADGDGKDDGIDTKMEEYESQDYIVETQKLRSSLTGVGKTVFLVVTQFLSAIMVITFASSACYKQGFKDLNLVKIGHSKQDFLKGFKIGILGNVPFFLLAGFMVVMATGFAPEFRTVWYAFLNGHFYSLVIWISKGVLTLGELNVAQIILLVVLQFIVPVISGVAYILGYKEINLAEKLVYAKEVE